jgi:hypothetical protein
MRSRWGANVEHCNPGPAKTGKRFEQRRAHATRTTGYDSMFACEIHSQHVTFPSHAPLSREVAANASRL